MLGKDLRLVRRGPAVVAALLLYPLLVAFIVALALQGDDRRPVIAVVNLDASGRTVAVGDQRLSIDDYIDRLADDVDVRELPAGEAADALAAGRVSAVLTIPERFIADLQAGVSRPRLVLQTNRRSPIEADAISRRLEAAIFRLNQRLAEGYVDQVLALVDLVVNGGQLGVFGRDGEALGLGRSREIVTALQRDLRSRGDDALADRLDPLLAFVDTTGRNLDLARPAAEAIRAPIELDVEQNEGGREPLSAFGLAAALLVSLGLAGALLAAALTASEREDRVLSRLGRGLVAPGWLAAEKMALTAAACLVVGLVLLGGVAATTSLAVSRWAVWLPALALCGLAVAGLGVLAGALARETRTALLVTLMVAVPLLALGLLPGSRVAGAVSQVVPFGPAFDLFQTLLVEPSVGAGDVLPDLGHLALIAAIAGTLAALALRRRASD
ncbi:MAG: ABC transporter permease [Thermoleophilia bacterium]